MTPQVLIMFMIAEWVVLPIYRDLWPHLANVLLFGLWTSSVGDTIFHWWYSTYSLPLEAKLERSSHVLSNIYVLQVGIGLLVLQQLGGINGVLFYSSTIFASAGRVSNLCLWLLECSIERISMLLCSIFFT